MHNPLPLSKATNQNQDPHQLICMGCWKETVDISSYNTVKPLILAVRAIKLFWHQ